jgi:hypothetical protein
MKKPRAGNTRTDMLPTATPTSLRPAPQSSSSPAASLPVGNRHRERFNWIPLGGLALTVFGVLGFAVGRAYTWTYAHAYGITPQQFSLPVYDIVYMGYVSQLDTYFSALAGAFVAFFVIVCIAYGSQVLGRHIDPWLAKRRKGPRPERLPLWIEDKVGAVCLLAASSTLMVLVVLFALVSLLVVAEKRAVEGAKKEREAFATWNSPAMVELGMHLVVVTVSPSAPAARPLCGYMIFGTEKLLALSDGVATSVLQLEQSTRLKTLSFRFNSDTARRAAACECGIEMKDRPKC